MIRPTTHELHALSLTERAGYRLADLVARRARGLSVAWNSSALVALTWLLVRRRLRVSGLEHVHALDPERGTVLVANHRSFFDFFAIECALFSRTRLSRRLLFPVRAPFFYDHWAGIAINLLLAGMTMFPPIQRDPRKSRFNAYALRRCAAELEHNHVVLGVHPEGTRSRDPDPFRLGRGRLGIGEILLYAPRAHIVPVFVAGLSNRIEVELTRNWRHAEAYPVHIGFGPRVDVSDLHAEPDARRHQREAVRRCMAAIAEVGAQLRPAIESASARRAPSSAGSMDAGCDPA